MAPAHLRTHRTPPAALHLAVGARRAPGWANVVAQRCVAVGGLACAAYGAAWVRQGMRATSRVAEWTGDDILPPHGAAGALLVPGAVAATTFLGARRWARSFAAAPISRQAASLALATAAALTLMLRHQLAHGGLVGVLLGTGVAVACLRSVEAETNAAPRAASPAFLPPRIHVRAPNSPTDPDGFAWV